ncbi:MAG: PAS domain S-box protein [Bacteroidales bacterium]|nr:PAS domain S-box protein [Bacteroidales bacterium]
MKKANLAKGQELEAIARLKSDWISNWIIDQLFDAKVIAQNGILIARLEIWLNEPSAENKRRVSQFLEIIKAEHGYEGIFIAGEAGKFLLSSNGKEYSMAPFLKEKVQQSLQSQSVLTTDLYWCPVHDTIHMDFISPLNLPGRAGTEALVFQFDPNKFLYPHVQSWPTVSKTSETLLYRVSGDNILFLNELKHKKNTALKYTLPLTEKQVVAVKAVNTSLEGFVEGKDYRGREVLGYVNKIPYTEWVMVSKTDKKELFSSLYHEMAIVIFMVAFLLLFLAAGMAFLYNSRQKSIYRDLYKQQEYYRITLNSIGDAVISTNHLGKVEFLNPVAEKITGWMNRKAQGKNLEEVFKIINEESRQAVESSVQKVLREGNVVGLANHTVLLSKDGREIPIADSGAPIKNEKGEITGVVLVFRDQSEEREYLNKISQSEAQYRELVESTDAIAWEYDLVKDKWIYVAPQVSDKLGWLPAEWTNLEFWKNNVHPDEREEVTSYCFECTAKGEPHSLEYRFRSKDGPYIWLRDIVSVELQENKPVILRGVMFDISERKNAEIQLKDREFWLSESQRVGKIGSYDFDIVKNHWSSSEVLDQIFGISKENSHSLASWFAHIHPEQRQEMQEYFQNEVLKARKPFDKEYKIIRQNDGAERWVCGLGELRFNEKGEPVGMFGTIQDITERKLFSQQLLESEELVRKAVLLAPIPMMVHDEEGNVLNISEGWTHFSGYTLEDIPTLKEWTEKAYGGKAIEVEDYVTGLFNEDETILSGEFEIAAKSGEKRIWNFYTTPLGKLNDKTKLMLSLAPDITQRKRVQVELEEAKEKAEEGERLKTAFLANMSHEIRTPLNGILGFTNLIARDDNMTSDKKKWYASIINKSAEGLLKIINDILDISKLETGKAIIVPVPFDIDKTFFTLHSIFQKKLTDTEKKAVRLILKNPGEPLVFHTDETRLIQVFSNLLDNALRFTSKGSITFGISGIQGNKAEFFVADTGIGIAKENQEAIFDRFSQGDLQSRSYG